MKRAFAYLLLTAGILTAKAGHTPEKTPTIATTHNLIREWVEEIAADTLTIQLITPEAPPRDNTSLIIETVLEAQQADHTPNVTQIVLSDGLPLLKINQPLLPKSCKKQNAQGARKPCCCTTSKPAARYEAAFAPELLNAPLHPYAWMDVSLAMSMVISLTEALCELNPQYATSYKEKSEAYLKNLEELDLECFKRIDELPQSSKKEPNPSWRYFSRRYGLEPSNGRQEQGLPSPPPTKNTYIETMRAYTASLKNKGPEA